MKVALIGPSYPYRGGIAHYTASLYRAFVEHGHRVRLFNFSRQYPKVLFPGQRQTDASDQPIEVPSVRCIDTLNPLSWVTAAARIARFRPEMAVFQWWHPYFAPSYGAIARMVRRTTRAEVVFLCHNVWPHEASLVDKALLMYAYGSAHAFYVQAEEEAAKLREVIGRGPRITVVPHPTYDVFASSHEPMTTAEARKRLGISADKLMMFFGLVRPYKGLSDLIEALPRLRDPSIELLVAGEFYEKPDRYHQLIDALDVKRRVHIHDRYIPNEEVPLYFAAADLVVLPYRSATQSGIVQIAYALGVPVIVTSVGGIPDVVENRRTGLLVPPGEPDVLAKAIDTFYEEDLASALRRGIEQRRGELTWSHVVDALTEP